MRETQAFKGRGEEGVPLLKLRRRSLK